MKTRLFLRLAMFAATLAAIVFGILSLAFHLTVPGAMFFCLAAVFLCFCVLTLLERKQSSLRHWKFMFIFSAVLFLITLTMAILEVVIL